MRSEFETTFQALTNCDYSIYLCKNEPMQVHESKFALLTGNECFSEYWFSTETPTHFLCKVSGTYPPHRKRVTPDTFCVNVCCLQGIEPAGIPERQSTGAAMP